MIQIDDAGSGSFIGGTCIGIYRLETNEYDFDIIPVTFYDRQNFKNKSYLDAVVRIVASAFEHLDVRPDEAVEVCRGYMFERLEAWLGQNGYHWKRVQITGRAQEIVERNFEIYAIRELGLPRQYVQYTRYPFHFHKLLRWVFADPENRTRHCKLGWKSWKKIEGIVPEAYDITTHLPHLICMKCGEYIQKGSNVRVLRFVTNKENFVYLHAGCAPDKICVASDKYKDEGSDCKTSQSLPPSP